MGNIKFSMTEPDFITYYDNGKLFLYSHTLNDRLELTDEVLKNLKIVGNELNHVGFGIINFKINDSRMPLLVPNFVVGLFNSTMNEIERFNKIFFDVVINEINLRGKKIESLTSSNVNQQSFEYLYRNNPKYVIKFQFDIKYLDVINKYGIIGFSLNYPKEVSGLSNGTKEVLNQIKNLVYELYNNDNTEYEKSIKKIDKKEKSTIEVLEIIPNHVNEAFEIYKEEYNRLKNDNQKALVATSRKVFENKERGNYKGANQKNVTDSIRSDFQKYGLIPKKQR